MLRPVADDFWAGVAVGDALLLAAIGDGEISAAEEQEIVAAYLDPWRRGGSRLKLSSVTEQLEFLAVMLADGPEATGQARQALIVSLNRIRGRVAKIGSPRAVLSARTLCVGLELATACAKSGGMPPSDKGRAPERAAPPFRADRAAGRGGRRATRLARDCRCDRRSSRRCWIARGGARRDSSSCMG